MLFKKTTNWEAIISNGHLSVDGDVDVLAHELNRTIGQTKHATAGVSTAEQSADKVKAVGYTRGAFFLSVDLQHSSCESQWHSERTIGLQP